MGSVGTTTQTVSNYSIKGWRSSTTSSAKILEALDNGADLTYVAGRFGGFVLTLGKNSVDVRGDRARKAINDGELAGKTENGALVYRANKKEKAVKSSGESVSSKPSAKEQAYMNYKAIKISKNMPKEEQDRRRKLKAQYLKEYKSL